MFGGYGFYKDGIFFALIIADILYFKVDDVNLADYKANGSQPFSYVNKNGKRVAMSYWKVPGDILENNDKLTQWVEKSIAAARRAKHK
jgi:DNA transformation protein